MNIVCGKGEISGAKIGDVVTVTDYRPATVGSGRRPVRQITGVLKAIGREVRHPGCGMVWIEAEVLTVSNTCAKPSLEERVNKNIKEIAEALKRKTLKKKQIYKRKKT